MNNRRKLVIALVAGTLTAPFAALAQQKGKVWRIGFLGVRPVPPSPNPDPLYMAFLQGMRELGYAEGRNLEMVWRSSEGNYERLPNLAAELVQLKVDVIVATGGPVAPAAQQATETIPIVMIGVGDPVGVGLIASLSKPGKNITGVSTLAADISIKSLEFLRAVVPKLLRVAVLVNPSNPAGYLVLKQVQAAAKPTGISVSVFEASSASQIDAAFAAIARARPGALIVAPDPYYFGQASRIAVLAAKIRVPAIYSFSAHAEAGGLMSYGENLDVHFRRATRYVDKILKGAKPADLPVEQPTKFELVINMKTAKALGLTMQDLLFRADKVIE